MILFDDADPQDRGPWFLSLKGRQIYPWSMRPEDLDPEEIAHSLSMLCRFNGHCPFYSVAEHSVRLSEQVGPEHAFCGLMHDATEAYCGDLIRPIKRHLPSYEVMEDAIWRAIARRFAISGGSMGRIPRGPRGGDRGCGTAHCSGA